jgi:outer membrane protein
MIKKVLSATVLLLFSLAAVMVGQPRIGYMNTQKVINNLPQRKRVQKKMDTFVQEKQKKLTKRATQYRQAVTKFQKNKDSMTKEKQDARQKELLKEQASLNKYNQTIRQEVQQKRQQLLSPIFNSIDSTIAVVAKEKNLDFVLSQSTSAGNKIIFYAAPDQPNISEEVLNRLTPTSDK